jgi:hypothetical protein
VQSWLTLQQTVEVKPLSGHLLPNNNNEGFRHPVEQVQQFRQRQQQTLSNWALRNVYGEHMVMRLEMEKSVCSSFARLPVLKSEQPSLASITKADLDISFGSSFSKYKVSQFSPPDPYESETYLGDVHQLTEKALKL